MLLARRYTSTAARKSQFAAKISGINQLSLRSLSSSFLPSHLIEHSRRINQAKVLLTNQGRLLAQVLDAPAETGIRNWSQAILENPYGAWLRNEANRAGIWREPELEKLMHRKLESLIVIFILVAILIPTLSISMVTLLVLPLVAFFIPDLLLLRRRNSRIRSISSSLPETIDLISMCVTPGIGFHSGMQLVADTAHNPLSEEFSRVLAEMQNGVSRSQALLSLSQRIGVDELRSFVNAVLQVERLGIPMAKVLEEKSQRMRVIRRERAREHAQKLPVKILGPIMLFMLPALLIIVLGPAVVTIVRTFS